MKHPVAALLTQLTSADAGDEITEKLLDAARDEFELVGIRRASMVDIAKRAKFARITLYRRFPDKDSLVQAVATREVLIALTAINAEIAQVESAEDVLTTLVSATLRAVREHKMLQRVVTTEPESLLDFARDTALLEQAQLFIAPYLHQLQEAGQLPDEDLTPAVETVARLVISLGLTQQGTIPFDDDERLSAYARRFIVPIFTGNSDPS